jgi:hypothetical protein
MSKIADLNLNSENGSRYFGRWKWDRNRTYNCDNQWW